MTNREFYVAVINDGVIPGVDENGVPTSKSFTSEEIKAKAMELIEKMDAANAKRREKIANGEVSRKVSPETIEKREAILGALTTEPQTSAQIGEAVGFSKNMVAGTLRSYVAKGEVFKGKVKMEGSDGKLHEYVTYSLPVSSTEE